MNHNLIDLTGQVFGRLTVIERASDRGGRTCWTCRCECGAVKVVASKELRRGQTRSCGCLRRDLLTGPLNRNWKGDTVGNCAAHDRVKRLRGPASDHACADGCGNQAAEWSHLGAPGEWSPRPEDYEPRCASCHKRHDGRMRFLLTGRLQAPRAANIG